MKEAKGVLASVSENQRNITMGYRLRDLPLEALLPHIGRADDKLARLDERTRRSPVGAGFVERGHFFDSAASMWVSGELVHVFPVLAGGPQFGTVLA